MRPISGGYRVLLTDGTTLGLDGETRARHGLEPGVVLEPAVLDELRRSSALRDAETVALRILSRADHTTRGLTRKLLQRGHDEATAKAVVERLRGLGYLDDERVARAWVERRLSDRPLGRAALLAGLERHGVPRELAERVIGAAVSPTTEAEGALRLLERLYPTTAARRALRSRVERDRALRRLAGRGFSGAAARGAVDSLARGGGDGQDSP